MGLNNKLRAVAIIGLDMVDSYKALANYYNNKDYIIIGDGESSVEDDDLLTALQDRIDHNTRIDIIAHGNVRNGYHTISLQRGYVVYKPAKATKELFSILERLSGGNPLHVNLWSCYGDAAAKDVTSLSNGSLLITHSPAESPNINWVGPRLAKIIQKTQENNDKLEPLQNLMENLAAYYLNPFTISTYLDSELYSLSLIPNLISIFMDPVSELNSAAEKVNSFYIDLFQKIKDNGKAFYLKNINLQPTSFSSDEIENVLIANLIYYCFTGSFDKIYEAINILPHGDVN